MQTIKEFSQKHNLDYGTVLEISKLPTGFKLSKDSKKYPYWRFDNYLTLDDIVTYWNKGYVCLNHVITPESIVISREKFENILSSCKRYDFNFNSDNYWGTKEDEIFDEMRKISDEISESGVLKPGYMFGIGVADGSAHYVVTKVNKKSIQVELRKFCDGYSDNYLGIGRKLSMEDFENCYGYNFN